MSIYKCFTGSKVTNRTFLLLLLLCAICMFASCNIQRALTQTSICYNDESTGFNRKTIILRKNKPFANQIKDNTNAVFVIRYVFDLKKSIVAIPANCTLIFVGGKLKNGKLVGNNSTIEAGDDVILHNVELSGSWSNNDSYLNWFSTDVKNKYGIIGSAFNLGRIIHFGENANYYVQLPATIDKVIEPKNRIIIGNNATIIVEGGHIQNNLFYINENSNNYFIDVEGLNISGIGQYMVNSGDKWMYNHESKPFLTSNVIGFHFVGRGDFSIKNCNFTNVLYGVRLDESDNVSFSRNFNMYECSSDSECIMPVMIHHVNRTVIKKCNLTCSKSTSLIHHLYLSDCLDSIVVDSCYLYGGTGDPLDIYHSRCKSQIVSNSRIIANNYSAIVLDDIDEDVHISNCYLYASGRGCLYGYKCKGFIIGNNNTFETPVSDTATDNYIIHSPYSDIPLKIKLDGCSIKANTLHSAACSELSLDIDNCQMWFYTRASISRPTSKVTFNITNSIIKCPNFTRFSTLFDIRNANSNVNLKKTDIDRGEEVGDWLVYVDVPYKLNIFDCTCKNVKSIIKKTANRANTSSLNNRIIHE